MEVTVDIVHDLLPVYMSGDATADTRAAVESFLSREPALREIVESAGAWTPPPVEVPPDLEAQSLRRTRRLLARKNFWLAFAVAFSLVAQAVTPLWLADLLMLIGLACSGGFVFICRELSATGLEPPRRLIPRLVWSFAGALLGLATGHLIQLQSGWHRAMYDLPGVGFGIALWIGEKYRQIVTPEELDRPTTLFGDGH